MPRRTRALPALASPGQALDDVFRKVHSRRVQMSAIKGDESSDEQIPVPPAELNDLMFRISPGIGLRWDYGRDRAILLAERSKGGGTKLTITC